MHLTGRHIVNATPAKLWTMLMDTDTLAKIVPGVAKLEKTGEDTYKSILEIKLGPVGGKFTGDLHMEDKVQEKSFVLKVQQSSSIGNVNSEIKIDLAPVSANQTEIGFNGIVKMTGLLTSMGQRVMGGVANTLTKQFFAHLDKELEKENASAS